MIAFAVAVLRSTREPAAGDWREAMRLKRVAMARRDEVTRAVTFIIDGALAEAECTASPPRP
jgi:hypothetical protein